MMGLQRKTWILVAIAAGFGGVVLIQQLRSGDAPPASVAEQAGGPLYTFEEEAVTTIQIETQGQAVTFERDESGFWQMVEPENHPAEEAAIAFLLSRLTADGLARVVTVNASDREALGLDVPFATATFTLVDGTEHTLVLGGPDFSGTAYYALVDPDRVPLLADAGEVEVSLVAMDVVNAVDRPLEEWKAITDAPTTDGLPLPEPPPVEGNPDNNEENPAPSDPAE